MNFSKTVTYELFLIAFLILFIAFLPRLHELFSASVVKNPDINQLYLVNAIIDGDTITVNYNGEEKQVRLLGINTTEVKTDHSETECFSYEATAYVLSALRNREVYLRSDPENRDMDDFGRLLRYVDVPFEKDQWYRLNELLVYEGYAKATPEYPLSEKERYVKLEELAKEGKKGMWGKCEDE